MCKTYTKLIYYKIKIIYAKLMAYGVHLASQSISEDKLHSIYLAFVLINITLILILDFAINFNKCAEIIYFTFLSYR